MTIVVVTGASQGIGAETAKAFARLKNTTVILLARTESALQKVTQTCRELGADAHYFVCDVTDEVSVSNITQAIMTQWGAPDVIVNNAGVFKDTSFLNSNYVQFKEQLDVNLMSAYLITRAFIQPMVARKSGDIFFLCSIASLSAYGDTVLYTTAKHALLGLSRGLRQEMKPKGIRVTALMPGATLTPAWDGVDAPEESFMPAADIGKIMVDIHQLDRRTDVEEVIIRPRLGDLKLD